MPLKQMISSVGGCTTIECKRGILRNFLTIREIGEIVLDRRNCSPPSRNDGFGPGVIHRWVRFSSKEKEWRHDRN